MSSQPTKEAAGLGSQPQHQAGPSPCGGATRGGGGGWGGFGWFGSPSSKGPFQASSSSSSSTLSSCSSSNRRTSAAQGPTGGVPSIPVVSPVQASQPTKATLDNIAAKCDEAAAFFCQPPSTSAETQDLIHRILGLSSSCSALQQSFRKIDEHVDHLLDHARAYHTALDFETTFAEENQAIEKLETELMQHKTAPPAAGYARNTQVKALLQVYKRLLQKIHDVVVNLQRTRRDFPPLALEKQEDDKKDEKDPSPESHRATTSSTSSAGEGHKQPMFQFFAALEGLRVACAKSEAAYGRRWNHDLDDTLERLQGRWKVAEREFKELAVDYRNKKRILIRSREAALKTEEEKRNAMVELDDRIVEADRQIQAMRNEIDGYKMEIDEVQQQLERVKELRPKKSSARKRPREEGVDENEGEDQDQPLSQDEQQNLPAGPQGSEESSPGWSWLGPVKNWARRFSSP